MSVRDPDPRRETTVVDLTNDREAQQWRCPRGHLSWERTNDHFWCPRCARSWHDVDPVFHELVHAPTREAYPRDRLTFVDPP